MLPGFCSLPSPPSFSPFSDVAPWSPLFEACSCFLSSGFSSPFFGSVPAARRPTLRKVNEPFAAIAISSEWRVTYSASSPFFPFRTTHQQKLQYSIAGIAHLFRLWPQNNCLVLILRRTRQIVFREHPVIWF